MIAGGVAIISLYARKIENDGMRPNPLSRTAKGGMGGGRR